MNAFERALRTTYQEFMWQQRHDFLRGKRHLRPFDIKPDVEPLCPCCRNLPPFCRCTVLEIHAYLEAQEVPCSGSSS